MEITVEHKYVLEDVYTYEPEMSDVLENIRVWLNLCGLLVYGDFSDKIEITHIPGSTMYQEYADRYKTIPDMWQVKCEMTQIIKEK